MRETFYLLIDDDSIVNNMHSTLFQMLRIDENVFVFDNARDALDFTLYNIDKGDNDYIIFLDINMPMMTGWEFIEELEYEDEKSLKQIKVIMVTSSIDINDKERAKKHPIITNYISKPLRKEQVETLKTGTLLKTH